MALLMNGLAFFFKVLTIPLHLLKAVGLYGNIYSRVFPFLLCKISVGYNKKMHDKKKDLFSNLSEFKKSDGEALSILEIGCGTGANFKYYPSGCKVICTDPNPHFRKYLTKSVADNDHLSFERFEVASGEDLGIIESESVDTVVCTLVLCTVNDIPRTLQEAHRVLRPGGAFYFMEHVVADPSTWTYFFQHVLQPMWYYFGDGCEVTRTTWKDLESAGFSQLNLRHIDAPLTFMIAPHILGYAVK